MQYFRCKCGEMEVWTSMGVQPCDSCEKCNTVPGYPPDRAPEPHDLVTEITTTEYRGLVKTRTRVYCANCMKTFSKKEEKQND